MYGRYPKDSKFQSSENHAHQFSAFIGIELVLRQISATATARDRRKKIIGQIMLFIKSPKKCKSAKKISVFSSLNQYFPSKLKKWQKNGNFSGFSRFLAHF
jgi:hypothetical protein